MTGSWPVKHLPEIADLSSPTSPSIDGETEYPMVPMACIDEVSGLNTTYEKVRGQDLKSSRTKFLPGDILFAKITPCVENGKISVAPSIDTPIGFATTEVYRIGPGPEIDQRYLLHFLRSPSVRRAAEASMTGSTGRQRVPRVFFESLEVPVPPLNEQRRIVDKLDAAMTQVDSMRATMGEAEEVIASLTASSLKQVFSEVEGPAVTIGEVLVESRYGSSRKADAKSVGIPILRIPNIVGGAIDISDLKYLAPENASQEKLVLEPGDILVCRTNGSRDLVGRTAVFEEEGKFVFASYLIRLRVDLSRALPRYVSSFMNSPQGREQILRVVRTSAGQYNLNSTAIKNLRLPLPSLAEQQTFVERLERAKAAGGRLLSQRQDARETLDLAVSSLLDAAYRGDF